MTSSVARADAIVLVRAGDADRALDRRGVVVAVNRGGHLEKLARARFHEARIAPVDDNRSLPDLLGGHRVDAVVTDSLERRNFELVDTDVWEVLAHDRKAYWVSPKRPRLVSDLDQWIGARGADGWLETERSVWLDDPQRPRLPVDEATLVDHLTQRLLLMPLVAEVKRARAIAVGDPDREAALLESARRAAARAGLEPGAYLALVRAEIEAAKSIQRAVLAQAAPGDMRTADLPDLRDDIRPAIDRIDRAIRASLVWAAPVEAPVDEIVAALRVDAPVPGLDDETLRAIARAARGIPPVAR